ncbi:MAG: 2-C-methyl-D-erythritol 2,4-cyclodiphosphate synthase [Bacteroidia bacterium]|nr:2-C-methyl-D-erythritol 2,4-cyclodiphosphate synthase [Bacteroidia bacterium]
MSFNIKIGYGFDVHQLTEARELWLGGVLIPNAPKGAIGHSDADVLIHAICDALLGALALGDIGKHFPDTSAEFKNIDSKILLAHCVQLIHNKGFVVGNIDSTLILEQPKIMPYVTTMQTTLAQLLKVETDCVSIKATTSETIGYVGRKEGVCAHATALLYKL